MMKGLLFFCLLFLWVEMGLAYTADDCLRCHALGGEGSRLQISLDSYRNSVHGREGMACTDCHKDVREDGHERAGRAGAVSCIDCHDKANFHGVGSEHRPRCYSCHTRHGILEKEDKRSSVHPEALAGTCSACHPLESGRSDYLSLLPSVQIVSHGKQDFSRSYDRKNCRGCHQGSVAHGEKEPISNEECYKCHFSMMGSFHPKADPAEQPGVFAAALGYQFFIAALIGGGFLFFVRRFSGIGMDKRKAFHDNRS